MVSDDIGEKSYPNIPQAAKCAFIACREVVYLRLPLHIYESRAMQENF